MLFALLRFYLVMAAMFELHSIANILRDGATRSSPVLRELVGGGRNAEERKGIDALWIGFLWNLLICRLFLAYDMSNLPLFALVVCIHFAEAALFVRAVPWTRWKQEYWVVPFSIVQASVLFFAWVYTALTA